MSEFAGPSGDKLQEAVDEVDEAANDAKTESTNASADELQDLTPDDEA